MIMSMDQLTNQFSRLAVKAALMRLMMIKIGNVDNICITFYKKENLQNI